jgi:hypothetical protein
MCAKVVDQDNCVTRNRVDNFEQQDASDKRHVPINKIRTIILAQKQPTNPPILQLSFNPSHINAPTVIK